MGNHPQIEFARISRPVMDALPLGVVVLDHQDTVVWANRGWTVIQEWSVGHSQHMVTGGSYADSASDWLSIDNDDAIQISRGIRDVRTNRRDRFSIECKAEKSGEVRWFIVTVLPIDDFDPWLVLVTHQEITTRKEREESLELFRDAIEDAGEFVVIADNNGQIEYVNEAFSEWSGLSNRDARGQSLWVRAEDDRDPGLMDAVMTALQAGKSWREELRRRRADGEIRWESQTVSPIHRDEGFAHLVSIGRDITEWHSYVDELRRHAYYDSLTGLPNRVLFIDRLIHAHTRVQRSRQPLVVMFLDLNGFKSLNDRFGHQTGDVVLVEVAQRLTACLRASDTVARTGGDEFIFLLEEVATDDDAVAVARRIIEALARPMEIDGSLISISGSIGIAFNTPAIGDPETLLRLADIALYHAKAQPHDRFVIYHEPMTMPGEGRA